MKIVEEFAEYGYCCRTAFENENENENERATIKFKITRKNLSPSFQQRKVSCIASEVEACSGAQLGEAA